VARAARAQAPSPGPLELGLGMPLAVNLPERRRRAPPGLGRAGPARVTVALARGELSLAPLGRESLTVTASVRLADSDTVTRAVPRPPRDSRCTVTVCRR
jgi:hypothetical protein